MERGEQTRKDKFLPPRELSEIQTTGNAKQTQGLAMDGRAVDGRVEWHFAC